MEKDQMLKALNKLKSLSSTIEAIDAQQEEAKKYFRTSAWEYTTAQPKPPLNTNPNFGSGIRPRTRKQGE